MSKDKKSKKITRHLEELSPTLSKNGEALLTKLHEAKANQGFSYYSPAKLSPTIVTENKQYFNNGYHRAINDAFSLRVLDQNHHTNIDGDAAIISFIKKLKTLEQTESEFDILDIDGRENLVRLLLIPDERDVTYYQTIHWNGYLSRDFSSIEVRAFDTLVSYLRNIRSVIPSTYDLNTNIRGLMKYKIDEKTEVGDRYTTDLKELLTSIEVKNKFLSYVIPYLLKLEYGLIKSAFKNETKLTMASAIMRDSIIEYIAGRGKLSVLLESIRVYARLFRESMFASAGELHDYFHILNNSGTSYEKVVEEALERYLSESEIPF